MGQFAMRPVDLAPLIKQGEDLADLLGQDAVHRRAARGMVSQLAAGPAGVPAVRADLPELQHTAGPPDRPVSLNGLIDQIQQAGLGGLVDPVWDWAT